MMNEEKQELIQPRPALPSDPTTVDQQQPLLDDLHMLLILLLGLCALLLASLALYIAKTNS